MKTIQVTTTFGVQIEAPLDAEGRLRVNTSIQHLRPSTMWYACVCLPNDTPIADVYVPLVSTKEEVQEALKKLLRLTEAKYGCECVVMRAFV